jgi:hypothetical protein
VLTKVQDKGFKGDLILLRSLVLRPSRFILDFVSNKLIRLTTVAGDGRPSPRLRRLVLGLGWLGLGLRLK